MKNNVYALEDDLRLMDSLMDSFNDGLPEDIQINNYTDMLHIILTSPELVFKRR